jgi:hypothetical protein
MRAAAILCVLFAICGVFNCAGADATNRTNNAQDKTPQVKTIFEADAKLTDKEVKDVVFLAKQCGISQTSEVLTGYYLPGGERCITVKSVEMVKGADITYDEIIVGKTGWSDPDPFEMVKRVGSFWAKPSDKFTTHLRIYDFRGEKIRVDIGTDIAAELADKIIPLIAERKVRYRNADNIGLGYSLDEMKKMINSKPSGISKPLGGSKDGELWLNFGDTLNALQFHFEKGEVVLDQVIYINV